MIKFQQISVNPPTSQIGQCHPVIAEMISTCRLVFVVVVAVALLLLLRLGVLLRLFPLQPASSRVIHCEVISDDRRDSNGRAETLLQT